MFEAFVELPPLYPFPQGGNPNEPDNAEFSITVLRRAQAAEKKGVETLENMLALLKN